VHTVSAINIGLKYARIARGDAADEAGETPMLAAMLQSELMLSEEIPPGYLPLAAICSSGLPSYDRRLSTKLLGMWIRCGEQDNSCEQQRRVIGRPHEATLPAPLRTCSAETALRVAILSALVAAGGIETCNTFLLDIGTIHRPVGRFLHALAPAHGPRPTPAV
jgi:hypothetical protein